MRPLFTSAGQRELQRLSLGGTGAFLAFPGTGGHSGLVPSGLWVPPGGVASFMGSGAACGQLADSSWIGCHQGDILSISTFWSQCLGSACCFIKLPSGGSASRNPAQAWHGSFIMSFREPGV